MQAHAKHQQNHPDVGELFGDCRVGDPAGSERAAKHAADQVADDGRKTTARRQPAASQRGSQAHSQVQQEVFLMHTGFFLDFEMRRMKADCLHGSNLENWPRRIGLPQVWPGEGNMGESSDKLATRS